MKLIVGLGNPGRKYHRTRHNIGFEVLAEISRRHGAPSPRRQFQGETIDLEVSGARVVLLAPHTYMNCSGESILRAVDFYKLDHSELLIISDDFHLALGRLRFRAKGSSGGQKGLEDIIRCLSTTEFARLRIGIGEPPSGWESADYVLGRFSDEERQEVDLAVVRAADAAGDWVAHGTAYCMNQYNG